MGTGNTVFAITLKCEKPDLNVLVLDISLEAINMADDDAEKHQSQIQFLTGDALEDPPLKKVCSIERLVLNPRIYDEKDIVSMLQRLQDQTTSGPCPDNHGYTMNQSLEIYSLWKRQPSCFESLMKVRHLNQ